MKKIAFFNIYNGVVDRGAERTTRQLCRGLSKKFQVTLFMGGSASNDKNYQQISFSAIKQKKFKDSSLSFLRKFYLDCWSLKILVFTIKCLPQIFREKYDFLFPVNGGWQSLFLKITAVLTGKKLIIIGRAGIGRDDRWNLFLRPDVFIALTKKQKNWALTLKNKVKVVYIPNGVDIKTFCPNGTKIKTSTKKPIVLCVSAFMPNKRIELTIKAVSRTDAYLILLGEGILRNKLQSMAQEHLGRNRFLIKKTTPEKIADYYRSADIFTLVSKKGEAFGNVYLEALACNLPVVATDDQSRREIIGFAGDYVDPTNTHEYSNKISSVLEKKWGRIPRKQAEKFALAKIVKKYEELISSL